MINKLTNTCTYCKKENSVRKGRKYCSRECYGKDRKGKPSHAIWGEGVRKSLSEQYMGKGNPMYGKKPWNWGKRMPEISGENHPNYKGGWVQDGYKFLLKDGRQVGEHTYIMEQHIGRRINSNEVVHHTNGNRLDNRIENLELITRGEHMKIHEIGKDTRFRKGE
jgi:hypothetical protein